MAGVETEFASFVESVKNSRGPPEEQQVLSLSATATVCELVGDTAIAWARFGPPLVLPRPITMSSEKAGEDLQSSMEPSPFESDV